MTERFDFSNLKLPEGFEWGPWSGDYRSFSHPIGVRGQFGGVVCKVSSPETWQDCLLYAVAKAYMEFERTLGEGQDEIRKQYFPFLKRADA